MDIRPFCEQHCDAKMIQNITTHHIATKVDMSENLVSPVNAKESRMGLLAAGLPILVLLLIYGAGIVLMPVLVLKNYQGRNCAGAVSLHHVYTSLYPTFVEDTGLVPYVNACDSYLSSTSLEATGTAQQAFHAFQTYLSAYPNGLFATEARQHSGAALLKIANEQKEQKQYHAALATLNRIISGYAELPSAAEAWTLIPSVYAASGAELREAGDFEQAERVFNDFQGWAQTNGQTEHVSHAQSELVQTYWKWGLWYLDQRQYESALAKLELAVAADPQSRLDSAAQVKASQRQVYIGWGNDLLERGNFEPAIQKIEQAVSLGDPNKSDATDALVNAYIRWASDLQAKEDFQGALKELALAQAKATTDAMKQALEIAVKDMYLAFSKSSGPQARNAMKEALRQVCEKHKKPDLPIFGLNTDSIRYGIYGIEDKLPENVVAKTPGDMHYIACVETANETIETRWIRQIVLYTSRGYYFIRTQQFRVQMIWNAGLFQTDTGQSVDQTILEGGAPVPFPAEDAHSGNYFYGTPPMDELVEWMQSVRK